MQELLGATCASLSATAAHLYRSLGQETVGDFDRSTAANIAAMSEADALAGLSELCDVNLVIPVRDGYAFANEIVRDHARSWRPPGQQPPRGSRT